MKFSAILLLPAMMWAGVACGQGETVETVKTVDENSLTVVDAANHPEESVLTESEAAELVGVVLNSPKVAPEKVKSESFEGFAQRPAGDEKTRYSSLSEADYKLVAKELGVEVAAIKAVVEIEAGKSLHGFYAPGVPVINFDASMYRTYASKVSDKSGFKNMKVPDGLSGVALKEWTQLVNACKKNGQGGLMGTFWGMFQIGGFNYKQCGCSSVTEFVKLMSDSEFAQLELFAKFISNSGMVKDLRNKNWAAFARKYNGTSYARRGYHTRMAAAYSRYKSKK
ncbi:MAG: N-acetylmuramidase family protein [Bacteroides sp.]|nr:N-acetylmuramidase family protein [Bacteroides sp.]MBD5305982.1 N-acetylmuramidase family protein [Bacteroides sp.]